MIMPTDTRKREGRGPSPRKVARPPRKEQELLWAKQLDYDVDAWEPSLLERMARASGRLQNR